MSLRVLRPGLLTTVQDLGRPGHQHEGITVGGAMDPFALRLANLLVGNDEHAAALELTLIGPTLRIEADVLLAITGGDLRPVIDDRPVPMWHAVRVRAGATLSFRGAASGCRAYLAVAGGIDVPVVLGSRSTHLRARFGGLDGRPLREADVVPLGLPPELSRRLAATIPRTDAPFAVADWLAAGAVLAGYGPNPVLRLLRGPEFDRLTPASRERLFGGTFRVAPESDRMGYRLEGPPLEVTDGAEAISEGVATGTLQLPPDGTPIALMADRQTTGGYPRIGHVAAIDRPRLAQLRPGDELRFREIGLAEAQARLLAMERAIAMVGEAIRWKVRGAANGSDRAQGESAGGSAEFRGNA
ncbi:MAG TPA: biotin-dependent carboxyltransferase family protein [Longimicrobiales bacterium]